MSDASDLERQRRQAADGLRVLMAIIVLADNALHPYVPKPAATTAVHVFCVLCGYAASFPPGKATGWHWLLRRAWQLGLPLLVWQAVTVALWQCDLTRGNFGGNVTKEEVLECYTVGLQGIWCSQLNGPLWVLEVLFLGPLLVRGLQSSGQSSAAAAAFAAAYTLGSGRFGSHWAAIILGSEIRGILPHLPDDAERRGQWALACLFPVAAVAALVVLGESMRPPTFLYSLTSAAIVLLTLGGSAASSAAIGPLARGSKYTYALYIVQGPIVNGVGYKLGVTPAGVAAGLVAIPAATLFVSRVGDVAALLEGAVARRWSAAPDVQPHRSRGKGREARRG